MQPRFFKKSKIYKDQKIKQMETKNLFKSLAAFQQECPTIHKGTQGYGYSYADLPGILEIINPLLKKHNLGFTQLLQGSQIQTIIFHVESGETLESIANIPLNVTLKGMNDFQVAGSAITYFRRYALSAALGIVTDKDTDAAGTNGNGNAESKIIDAISKAKPKINIKYQLKSCETKEDVKLLWVSLTKEEQAKYRDQFTLKGQSI